MAMANLPCTGALTSKDGGSLTSYAPANVRAAMRERMIFSDAIEKVVQMLKSYPPTEGTELSGYLGMLAATLLQYPKCVAIRCADPIKGVASATRFRPTVADLTVWCEREMEGLQTIVDRDDREKQFLADRQRAEKQEEKISESKKRGETVGSILKKHWPDRGFTDEGLIREPPAPYARAARDQESIEQKILAEYERVGKEPFRSGNLLISPSLVAALQGARG